MDKEKAIKESAEVLSDLSLISKYMHDNDSSHIFMVLGQIGEAKTGTFVMENLKLEDLPRIIQSLGRIVESKIEGNECDCEGCKKAIELLKKMWGVKKDD